MADDYAEFFARSPDVIFIMDGDSIVDLNPPGLAMLGFSDRETLFEHYGRTPGVAGLHPSLISAPIQSDGTESRKKAEAMMAIARQQGSHRFDWDHVNADGEVFPSEVLLTWIGDEGNDRFHVTVRDTSEQAALAARLQRAERVRTLATLAGGVAHDFNNLLMVLRLHAEALELDGADSGVRRHAAAIQEAVDRAADLTGQLLRFSQGEMAVAQPTNISDAVASVADLMRVLAGEHISVSVRTLDTDHAALIDPGQVEQILINLVTNARDAMPKGGTIDVEVRNDVRRPPDSQDDPIDVVVLTVTDSGVGMDPEQVAAAFEPFVSEKPVGVGSGLGLAIVQALADQNDGWAEITSEPGVGTGVSVALPRIPVSEVPDAAEPLTTDAPAVPQPCRVLVVEDHPSLREILSEMLAGWGYDVVTASNGREALDLADAPGEFDVVVTDVVMPELGGHELIEALATTSEEPLRAVLMSGYSPPVGFVPPAGVETRRLTKPFAPSDLDAALRSLLAAADDRVS